MGADEAKQREQGTAQGAAAAGAGPAGQESATKDTLPAPRHRNFKHFRWHSAKSDTQ